MEIIKTDLDGVFIIKNKIFQDERGTFIKTFNKEEFEKNNLCTQFNESYFSISNKDVIRGMHFQLPPFEHEKLVYVTKGKILDVVVDLRKNSKTLGKSINLELSEENGYSIYIPKGLAHGFKSLENGTTTIYNVATVYNPENDYGIKWDSFEFDWQIATPIISIRDKNFETMNDFLKKEVF